MNRRPKISTIQGRLHGRSERHSLWAIVVCFLFLGSDARCALSQTANWENSIVTLDATRKQYDHFQPWTRRLQSRKKAGLVLDGKEILTTADEMFDRTLVRIQKHGRGKWFIGDVSWIDYHANLAIVTTKEAGFWEDLEPVQLPSRHAVSETMQIVRWREGRLESRKVEYSQFTVDTGDLSFVPRILLELSSEIQGTGWGEPVISGGKVLGLAVQHTGNKITALPTSFIEPILGARRSGEYRGLGYFDFYWQATSNPQSLDYLKLEGEPRGAMVIEVPSRPGAPSVLRPKDIILRIDGFEIDTQGDYIDPDYGHLLLENLATRGKWAGDNVPMTISRGGDVMEIQYRLPKADFSTALVPDSTYDQEPEYFILGGLVFQPLNDPFLRGWGPDWKRRSPFRIYYFNNQSPTPEQPSLVLLSQVLPDVFNLGYHDLKYLVVDRVNGVKISNLRELSEAFKTPRAGFHVVEFMQSDSLRRLVLSTEDQAQATQRVLSRYGIPHDRHFAPPSSEQEAAAKN
ncbi:MAG: hypothetical protein O2960_08630 [Verrucomicrobia bacterium]|nr:hypothetical protein [Verrucomicrobiota bacterium]